MLDWFVRCVDCGASVESESAAETMGWRFFPDPLGQLQPHCAACSLGDAFLKQRSTLVATGDDAQVSRIVRRDRWSRRRAPTSSR